MSFYGNITNNKSQFIYDRYYPNRDTMDAAANSDGVFIGRYVYIDYSLGQGSNYNFQLDLRNNKLINGITNHATVWQKVWRDQKYQYILIGRLDATPSVFDLLFSRSRDIIREKPEVIPTDVNASKYVYLDNNGVYWRIKTNIDDVRSWEVLFNLNASTIDPGNNSIMELMLNLYDIQQVLLQETNTVIVTQEQLDKILSYFDAEYEIEEDEDPEYIEEKEDDFMVATDTYSNGTHFLTMTVSKYDVSVNRIIPLIVKFETDYKIGDTILVRLISGDTIARDVQVYMANGNAAIDGVWKANTLGLVSIDLDTNKAYINSAIPTWSV